MTPKNLLHQPEGTAIKTKGPHRDLHFCVWSTAKVAYFSSSKGARGSEPRPQDPLGPKMGVMGTLGPVFDRIANGQPYTVEFI